MNFFSKKKKERKEITTGCKKLYVFKVKGTKSFPIGPTIKGESRINVIDRYNFIMWINLSSFVACFIKPIKKTEFLKEMSSEGLNRNGWEGKKYRIIRVQE